MMSEVNEDLTIRAEPQSWMKNTLQTDSLVKPLNLCDDIHRINTNTHQ